MDLAIVEALAAQLIARSPDDREAPLALLCATASLRAGPDIVYFARKRRTPNEPDSSVVTLVQGIWESFSPIARSLVRRRIYCTYPLTVMDRSLIRVAAKRASGPIDPRDRPDIDLSRWHAVEFLRAEDAPSQVVKNQHEPLSHEMLVVPPPPRREVIHDPTSLKQDGSGEKTHQHYMTLASALAARAEKTRSRATSARSIGAVLVSRDGTILAKGVNSAGSNRTRHAEVNLLQDWWRREARPIPAESKLFTTLKPCKMCASMLWTSAEDPFSLRVHYRDHDPGPFAQTTILNANSPERRLECQAPEKWHLELEEQLSPSS